MSSQKGAIHLFLPLVVLAIISLVAFSRIQTTTKYDDSNVQGVSAKNSDNNPGRGSSGENKGSSVSEVRSNSETQTTDEKSKVENKQIESSVTQGSTKSKIQQSEKVTTKATELKNEVEDEASGSGGETEDKDIQELRSTSKFPLRIDTSTNQLIMTKNGVERVLTTLPAKAVQNMLRAHLKKGLGPKFFESSSSATPIGTPSATPVSSSSATPSAVPTEAPIATGSADITVLESQITLDEENGQIVYKILAKKQLKLFGFIPITTDLTGFVSAQSGALLEEKESLLAKILSKLSP